MLATFDSALDAGLHVDETGMPNLGQADKSRFDEIEGMTKQFLVNYMALYSAGKEKEADELYNGWSEQLTTESVGNVAPYIEKLRSNVEGVRRELSERVKTKTH
jgi:hypothetical protein